jgi:hypothetical protein
MLWQRNVSLLEPPKHEHQRVCPAVQIAGALETFKKLYPPKNRRVQPLAEHLASIPMKTSIGWEVFEPDLAGHTLCKGKCLRYVAWAKPKTSGGCNQSPVTSMLLAEALLVTGRHSGNRLDTSGVVHCRSA